MSSITVDHPESPVRLENKKVELILRLETDEFQVCRPKIISIRKYLIVAKKKVVHRMANDTWDIIEL